jgi:hypothetical protein
LDRLQLPTLIEKFSMHADKGNAAETRWQEQHEPERQFFRCAVASENSAATLRFSRTNVPVELHESSIDGFAVLVQQKYIKKIRLGPRWVLQTVHERTEVWPQWVYCAPDGRVQIGLRRLQDLTPAPKPKWWPRLRSRRGELDHTLFLATLILLLVLALSLPGLGDALGTAPLIEQTLREFVGNSIGRLTRGG